MRLDFTKKNFFIFIILSIFGFAIYANSFIVPFFWDDNDNVINNVYVKSWRYLTRYFSENLISGSSLLSNYWRPFLLITYSLDYNFFGLNKYWWHFVDVFLHILSAFFLFLILDILIKKKWFAFLVSLIFLVHPVHTEAITQITGRADPLFFFFILVSIFFYLKNKYPLSILMFGLSLLSKETAIILPALLILIEICFPRDNEKRGLKSVALRILPFFILAGVYFWGRLTILNFKNTLNFYEEESLYTSSVYIRLLSFLKVLPIYCGLLLYPHDLHVERIFIPPNTINFSLIIVFLSILFLIIFSILRWKRNRLYVFGLGWFLISIFPASNILIPINRMIYEHWLYVPMIGFFIFLIALFEDISLFLKKHNFFFKSRYVFLVVLIFYILFFCTTTIKRNSDWKTPIIFYNNVLKYNKNSLLVWNNLGMEYASVNELDRAEEAYKKAIELDINNASAPPHHNLGNLYDAQGKFGDAVVEFEKAISIDKNFFYSYNALANLYKKTKDEVNYFKTIERIKNL